jgi:hypothetical protein
MNCRILAGALIAAGLLGLAGPVSAQFYPGFGYGGWGGDGSAALLGSDYRQAAALQAKAQSRQAGQEAAMQQNYVVQSGIRSTLSSQAQSQANAIAAQQQATQDWWFQHQSQQLAPVPPSFAPSGRQPVAAMDIIQWPTALQDSCFASERAKIEAPYRRTPPKLSVPTAADYRNMAATVEDMKAVLEWRLNDGINTADYNAATTFLQKLGQEVSQRAQAAGSSN